MKLSEQVAAIEAERNTLSHLVGELRAELETLKRNPPGKELEEAKDRLIDLVEPDILWQEQNLDKKIGKQRERMMGIIAAYRAVRPKEE